MKLKEEDYSVYINPQILSMTTVTYIEIIIKYIGKRIWMGALWIISIIEVHGEKTFRN
jgi:hypothetical protein